MVIDDDDLLAWLRAPRKPSARYEEVVEILHQTNERTRFLKQLPHAAAVLDAGAGDGSLERFRSWLQPRRGDLRMYAYGAERGERFDSYDAHEMGCWPQQPPSFGGERFDAVIACHFVEHLDDPAGFVRWAVGRLTEHGRIYLEWPSEHSLDLPPRDHFVSAGIPLVISRFDDDKTHKELPKSSDVCAALAAAGARVEVSGVIRYPWLEDELLAHWQQGVADSYALQAAFWSRTMWSQFVIGSV